MNNRPAIIVILYPWQALGTGIRVKLCATQVFGNYTVIPHRGLKERRCACAVRCEELSRSARLLVRTGRAANYKISILPGKDGVYISRASKLEWMAFEHPLDEGDWNARGNNCGD